MRILKFLIYINLMLALSCKRGDVTFKNLNLEKSSILGFNKKAAIVIKDYALLKEERDENFNYINILRKNTILKILKISSQESRFFGENGYWVKVKYKKESGWVFSKHINIIDKVNIERDKF